MRTERITWIMIVIIIGSTAAGYALGQRGAPKVGIKADIATYTVNGSQVAGISTKKLTFVNLEYNDVSIPCVLADTLSGSQRFTADIIGGASISCGWTPEAIAAISAAKK